MNKLLPLVRPGGLILAHNVNMVPDYIKAVTTNADLETIFYMQGAGLIRFEEACKSAGLAEG